MSPLSAALCAFSSLPCGCFQFSSRNIAVAYIGFVCSAVERVQARSIDNIYVKQAHSHGVFFCWPGGPGAELRRDGGVQRGGCAAYSSNSVFSTLKRGCRGRSFSGVTLVRTIKFRLFGGSSFDQQCRPDFSVPKYGLESGRLVDTSSEVPRGEESGLGLDTLSGMGLR